MPVDGLIDSPLIPTFPAAAHGMLLRLCLHFWATECRPIPKSDDELRAIMRAHRPTWKNHSAAVLQAFEEWRPEAEAYLALRRAKKTTIHRIGERGRASRQLAKLEAQRPDKAASASSFHQLAITPVREPTPAPRPPTPANRPPRRVMVDRTR